MQPDFSKRRMQAFRVTIVAAIICAIVLGSPWAIDWLAEENDALFDRLEADSFSALLVSMLTLILMPASFGAASIVGPTIFGAAIFVICAWWKALTNDPAITKEVIIVLFLVLAEPIIYWDAWIICSQLIGEVWAFVGGALSCCIAALLTFFWWRTLTKSASNSEKMILIPLFVFLAEPIVFQMGLFVSAFGYVWLRGDAFIDIMIPVCVGPAVFCTIWPLLNLRWWIAELREIKETETVRDDEEQEARGHIVVSVARPLSNVPPGAAKP